MPVRLVWGLSRTRKAARLAVYEATMIMAKPAQTMPNTLAEKLLGVPIIKIFRNIKKIDDLLMFTFSNAGIKEDTPSEPDCG